MVKLKMEDPDKYKQVSDEDKKLFRDAVGNIERIKNNSNNNCKKPKPLPSVRKNDEDSTDNDYEINDTSSYLDKVDGNTEIKFCIAGENNRIFKRLRQGKIKYKDKLDLHSLTVSEAKKDLGRFINNSSYLYPDCVLIVHGKGYGSKNNLPIIKNQLNQWLRDEAAVWGFHSAQPKDGGTGAIYLILKAGEK
mgnify:CR=1 FL=1|tara:strand:+ start:438 stop:1013 length:576 start_codon:yes stop_codon:yes gene_type:complete